MAMRYLGATLDIHAGGVDLIFPHHENEIAQSEGATGKPFARFFIEGEHLLVDGQKMSKSLGNVFTLRDIETRHVNPLAFRYLTLTAHYRSKLNFTWESLSAAQNSLNRLHDFVRGLHPVKYLVLYRPYSTKYSTAKHISAFKKRFAQTLSNDLDTPKALAAVWKLISEYHKNPERFSSSSVLTTLYDFDRVLGLGLKNIKTERIPAKIKSLADEREKYRAAKEWAKADAIRMQIQDAGYLVEDSSQGPRIKRA